MTLNQDYYSHSLIVYSLKLKLRMYMKFLNSDKFFFDFSNYSTKSNTTIIQTN